MTIYIDVSAAAYQHAGLARYARSLAYTLVTRHREQHDFGLFYIHGRDANPLPDLHGVATRPLATGYKSWRMAVLLGHRLGIGFDRLLPDAELFHATEHLLMPLQNVPTVMTVHDLIYHLFPAYHRRLNYWYLKTAMPLYVRRANALITISESSKRDLIEHYQVDKDKITVIYEAASPRFRPEPAERVAEAKARYGLPDRYILALGTIEPRKNLIRLVDALRMLRRQDPELTLVIVGSAGWLYQDFFLHLEKLEEPRSVLLAGYVPDEDLPSLMTGAAAYVLASVYEGFGLPILEAMACGTPVVCSNTSSLPELGADAARYFDPHDVRDMLQAISAVLGDVGLREEMRTQGFEQAARFSWKRAAAETLALYERVMSS